jgi:CRP/FNR family putative post-exponential-phase nitrogen-starvation transcriptional regulator
MESAQNRHLLQSYIARYGLDFLFESNLTGCMDLFKFQKGNLICLSSTEMQYLYFLVSGKLKVYTLLNNGKSLLLRFNKPLSVIGDVEFLKGHLARCNVEALVDSDLIGIKFTDLHRYADHDPTFLRFLILHLSNKLDSASNSASLNQLYPLENRFASYLLSVSVDERNNPRVEEIKTRNLTEIALLLGTSYRHLHRVIVKLLHNGIIAKEKGTLTVLDFSKLKALAKNNLYE